MIFEHDLESVLVLSDPQNMYFKSSCEDKNGGGGRKERKKKSLVLFETLAGTNKCLFRIAA
jgi:hypothetical protein